MNNPKISVVCPVYNAEKILGKCIRSVLTQSYRNLELILVNDGSTDSSLKICQESASKDTRVVIIDKQNEGQTLARKDGFLKARGDYICFLDSDDYLASDALDTLYKLAEEHHSDMVIGNYDRVLDNWCLVKKKARPYREADRLYIKDEVVPLFLTRGNGTGMIPYVMWGRLIRRTCIVSALEKSDIPLFPLHCGIEDNYFNLGLAPFLESVRVSDITVYHYRFGGMTSRYCPQVRRSSSFYGYYFDSCLRYGCEPLLPTLFSNYSDMLLLDVVGQLHFQAFPEDNIRGFIRQEMEGQKIALWARERRDGMSARKEKERLARSIILKDADEFLAIAKERERFLQKNKYWKMKIAGYYQKATDAIARILSIE